MAKKQATQESQSETFDLNQYLGDDEIELAGESADFGDEPDGAQLSDDSSESPQQYDTEGLDEIGRPEKDRKVDDSADEPEPTDEDQSDADEPDAEEATEDEDEATTGEDEEADPEPEPEPERKQKDPVIPKRRLDSEIAKRRQLEQEMKQMREQFKQSQQQAQEAAKVPEEDIKGWLQQSAQKALDGETEESAQLQQKAFDAMATNRGEGQQGQQQEQMDPDDMVQQVEERVELKHKVKDVFEAYPSLDPNSDSFDEAMNEEVVELNDFYTSKGYTPSAAVERAVEVLAAQHQLKPANAQPEKPAKKPARSTKPNVKEKMDVADKQPAEPSNRRGNKAASEDTVDINTLDDEEMMALPENVRARLRGDV